MDPVTLLCFPESGRCYAVALTLELIGTPWRAQWVDYFAKGETRTPEWRAANSVMGEVPVLIEGGRRLTQSGVILRHMASRTGRLGAEYPAQDDEILRWILFDNHKFTSYLATWRFQLGWVAQPDPAVLAFLRARVDAAFAVVERQLADRDFLLGDALTIADLSLQSYLHYPDAEWPLDVANRYPAIAAWIARVRGLPGWRAPYDLLPGPRTPPREA
jgi:glutathione S-transferase